MGNLHKTAFRLLHNLHAVEVLHIMNSKSQKKRVSNENKCIVSYVWNERNHNNEKWIWKDTILMYVWVLMTFFYSSLGFSSSSSFKSPINRNPIISWWKKSPITTSPDDERHSGNMRLTSFNVLHIQSSSRNHFLNLLIWWHCVKFSDMMIRHYWKKSEITFFSWTLFSIKR